MPSHRLHSERPRGDGGFALAATLGLLFFVTVLVVAVLAMTATAGRATVIFGDDADRLRVVDSSMEEVMNQVRQTPASVDREDSCAIGSGGSTTRTVDGVDVECLVLDVGVRTRSVRIAATVGGTRLGLAWFKVVDGLVDDSDPGEAVVVCDWRLGPAAVPSYTSAEESTLLANCSA